MTNIKERPILFSAPMVRAILEGRKTVTRRPVKGAGLKWLEEFTPEYVADPANNLCPFGKPGDRLWVRETCFINDYREAAVPADERADCEIVYRADGAPDWEGEEVLISWRPSIHMPRWASRILLEITDVRVERLQDISDEQALAEGVRLYTDHADLGDWYHVAGFDAGRSPLNHMRAEPGVRRHGPPPDRHRLARRGGADGCVSRRRNSLTPTPHKSLPVYGGQGIRMLETIEVSRVKRFAANMAGRDFAVGDIHGHFTRLQAALDAAGFDPAHDRLFSVGDLVDRGPECEEVIKWLNKPWFHPVRGNHDDYVVRFDSCDIGNWMMNGGSWFVGLPLTEQQNYQVMFQDLPIAIEVETPDGIVGIVHADCVFDTWSQMKAELEQPESQKRLRLTQNTCMWSRSRFEQQDCRPIPDVRAVVVGHTPIERPVVLGNTYHIDTGGWMKDGSGRFTLLDLASLSCINP